MGELRTSLTARSQRRNSTSTAAAPQSQPPQSQCRFHTPARTEIFLCNFARETMTEKQRQHSNSHPRQMQLQETSINIEGTNLQATRKWEKNTMKQLNKDSSVTPSRHATCDWFYHSPSKQTEKTDKVDAPSTSQIPGLSDLTEPHNELKSEGRKKWIKESDSEYVKLAKQGGQPDLLKHIDPPEKKTQSASYAPPGWYSDEPLTPPSESDVAPLRNIPDYMIHEEFSEDKNDEKYEMRRGPFDFDQKTVWQRDLEENEEENNSDKKVKLPAIDPKFMKDNTGIASGKEPPSTKARGEKLGKKCFFPPMPGNKSDSVNIGKLLSNGYGDEWHRQHDEQDKNLYRRPK